MRPDYSGEKIGKKETFEGSLRTLFREKGKRKKKLMVN